VLRQALAECHNDGKPAAEPAAATAPRLQPEPTLGNSHLFDLV